MAKNHVKDERGQMFVEFALCLPIFLLLAFTIITVSFRALGNAYVREAAFEAARCYSVTGNADRAESLARKTFASTGGELFIRQGSLTIVVDSKTDDGVKKAYATVLAVPRYSINKFNNDFDTLIQKAVCNMEGRYRNPEDYLK